MDKNAIKKFAVWARKELIERVTQKAQQYEISADAAPKADAVRGKLLSKDEKGQRAKLISKVKEKGYEQVMEEVAYTWFNRFSALRFMEVNNYLPNRVRVFTDADGAFKPQILTEAIHMELKGLDMDKVYALKEANDNDELFKYLIITQCNALSEVLPGMFQRISDYTELLFPDNLLRDGSVIEKMVVQGQSDSIPEGDWKDQIQIIGWLYQYYNTEPKDKVFADLKMNVKITKDKIPAATQLFTPDWIVRYMVENSLGRLWAEGHPNTTKKNEWKYYLEEAEQESPVQKQLSEIKKEYAVIKPEDIRVIDPCSGSGHICAYLFDVLMQIYEDYGIQSREAVRSIIENNLWGLDIDDRAAQLAYFSVMMKAVQYDSRFLRRKDENGNPDIPRPHVYAIRESNNLDNFAVDQFVNGDAGLKKDLAILIEELHDAKEYGSILNVSQVNFDALYKRFDECKTEISMYQNVIEQDLFPFVQVAQALAQKYHAVVTNPPYMGASGMSPKLSTFVKKKFPNTKSDLSTVFMERNVNLGLKNGFISMINIPVWLTLKSFQKMRENMLSCYTFINLIHFGRGVFGSDFGTTAFVISKKHISNYIETYRKLYKKQGAVASLDEKEKLFFSDYGLFFIQQEKFSTIDGTPIAYALSSKLIEAFQNEKKVIDIATTRLGMTTADNNRFTRLWYEIPRQEMIENASTAEEVLNAKKKWVPYNKGGQYRKWYGNNDFVVNWENDGYEIKNFADDKGHIRSTVPNTEYYFKHCLTWSKVTAGSIAFRYRTNGSIFDVAGACLFGNEHLNYLLGFLNSKVALNILNVLSPTLNYEGSHIASLPVIVDQEKLPVVEKLVEENIRISKEDWDSFEQSWDFCRHPLIPSINCYGRNERIETYYNSWIQICQERFNTLKANEEELNNIFISVYGLQNELEPSVEDKDVTVRKAELESDIRSFIMFAVGCILGRYSLDEDGLIYAGGEWDNSKYKTFQADKDAILPVCDDEYFDDDITGLFIKFVKTVYGENTLEENLKFIADALGGGGTSREVIRNYFLNDFYFEHCSLCASSLSGKRPYYWLFDSGKKNGFKCLIYMHRYQPDTIARIRTDYVHEQQARYRTAIAGLERQIVDAPTSERVRLNKQLSKLKDQVEEVRVYEEKIHHLADQMISIDLDDGVKHNYEIFQDVLAKIK